MTAPELRKQCAQYALVKPCTLDDCKEIFADLKPQLPAGALLDVMLIDQDTIRITVGVKPAEAIVTIRA